MNLNEHQAKSIVRELGFRVPAGVVCDSADMAEMLAATLATESYVVKAQILAGGRARGQFKHLSSSSSSPPSVAAQLASTKPGSVTTGAQASLAGGIRFADSAERAASHCRDMIGGTLITSQTGKAGQYVGQVYLEERLAVERECYLALTIDQELGQLVFIVSQSGGSDIESVAAQNPAAMHRFPVRLDESFASAPQVAAALGLDGTVADELADCLLNMLEQFVEKDMLLIEINPLAVDSNNELLALDATVVFDDNALFRQGHPEQMEAYTHLPEQEYNAAVQGLNLVKLEGNIATLSAGAGLAMATIDAICENGGAPANFLDVPPSTAVSHLHNAVTLLVNDPDTSCLLVNVFGGGIMRCDAVADALLLAHREEPFRVPVVVRLAGTNADLGRERLAASLPEVSLAADLADAARIAVASASAASLESGESEVPGSGTRLWKRIRQLMPDNIT